MNRHLGSAIPNNHFKVTPAGKLLQALIEDKDLTLINSIDKTKNGPFTRYEKREPKNTSKMSAIDFVIIFSSLMKLINW